MSRTALLIVITGVVATMTVGCGWGTQIAQLEEQTATIQTNVQKAQADVQALRTSLAGQLSTLETQTDARLKQIDASVESHDATIGEVRKELGVARKEQEILKTDVREQFGAFDKDLKRVETKVDEFNTRLTQGVKKAQDVMAAMKQQAEDFEKRLSSLSDEFAQTAVSLRGMRMQVKQNYQLFVNALDIQRQLATTNLKAIEDTIAQMKDAAAKAGLDTKAPPKSK